MHAPVCPSPREPRRLAEESSASLFPCRLAPRCVNGLHFGYPFSLDGHLDNFQGRVVIIIAKNILSSL